MGQAMSAASTIVTPKVRRKQTRITKTARFCEECGREFMAYICVVENGGGRFCSHVCVGRSTAKARWERDKLPAETRFWRFVDKTAGPDGCWLWTGECGRHGYGQFRFGHRQVKAHRFAYECSVGPIKDGLLACHRCDNPPCCNPAHIFPGTNADNVADRNAKGRHAFGEKAAAAKLTAPDVLAIRSSTESTAALARRFSVSWSAVARVRDGSTWRHLF